MPTVALSLGSSLGPRLSHLRAAVAMLSVLPGFRLQKASRVSWTPAVGGVARQPFLNAVLLGETTLSPIELLRACKGVERRLGRRPSRRYAERVIDVDLLLFGAEILETSDLVLPHPRLPERDFFLDLLAEVWPEALDPRNGEPWTRTHPAQRRWPRVAMLARP